MGEGREGEGGCTEEFAPRRRERRQRRSAVGRCMVFLVGGIGGVLVGMLNSIIALREGSHKIGMRCRGEVSIGIEKWKRKKAKDGDADLHGRMAMTSSTLPFT